MNENREPEPKLKTWEGGPIAQRASSTLKNIKLSRMDYKLWSGQAIGGWWGVSRGAIWKRFWYHSYLYQVGLYQSYLYQVDIYYINLYWSGIYRQGIYHRPGLSDGMVCATHGYL